MLPSRILAGVAIALLASSGALAAQQGAPVELSNGASVPQKVTLPALHLTNAQREQIRKAVLTPPTEVEFHLKTTKSAQSFNPSVGAKLPKGIKGNALPQTVLAKLPQLRDYKYVKMKNQVLIVDAMTKKIVDMFPETQPVM